ncbi:MAG TPA: DUF2141 domain-containing protein [Flavobacteriaceae bacterium]|jgi:uncharacterized protein (DUF2141 family)|nr:hypothetical protein [Flavobacteriaceae bacterium]HIB48465.1 DUF2141 domain-containing protein [Flavobacteriaceae bacterium]HIN98329.1 DUF2141 domain-containing protein [Flavobacteriaceae bacterium]|tara:strand:- start:79 stop:516 length:438 start_codon:yes stop_codon:yes gene_type:complete
MKTIITTLAFLLFVAFTNAQANLATNKDASGTTITITVPVKSEKGEIIAALYNEETFMKAAPLQGATSEIKDGKALLTFQNVTPGTYGITLFHDTNGNQQMDFEPNGMPKENYGVSNNVMSFGPPQWKDAKFEVTAEPIEMEIIM